MDTTPHRDDELTAFAVEVAELDVFLPGQQAEALERAARERGLTVAQMVRRLIQEFLQHRRGMASQGA